MSTKHTGLKAIKGWQAIIIAILSAITGALGESVTNFIGITLNLR